MWIRRIARTLGAYAEGTPLHEYVAWTARWYATWLLAPFVLGVAFALTDDGLFLLFLVALPLLFLLTMMTIAMTVQGVMLMSHSNSLRDRSISGLAAPMFALTALGLALPAFWAGNAIAFLAIGSPSENF